MEIATQGLVLGLTVTKLLGIETVISFLSLRSTIDLPNLFPQSALRTPLLTIPNPSIHGNCIYYMTLLVMITETHADGTAGKNLAGY